MTTPVTPVLPPGSQPDTGNFQIASQPANVGFLKRAVQPPSNVYIETSDVLVFACATNQSNELLTVSYRFLRFDGIVIHGQFTIQPPSNRSLTVHQEQLAEGFLLSMSCKATAAITRGQTFARAFLTKPSLGAGQPSYMLMADYVTTAMAPAFPNGRITMPAEGPGWRHTFAFQLPSPGHDFTTLTLLNQILKVYSGTSQFAASAVAGNRFPGAFLAQGGTSTFNGFAENIVQANGVATICYSATPNKPTAGDGTYWVPLPPNGLLAPFSQFGSATPGILAGDQYSNANFDVEEWLDNV